MTHWVIASFAPQLSHSNLALRESKVSASFGRSKGSFDFVFDCAQDDNTDAAVYSYVPYPQQNQL